MKKCYSALYTILTLTAIISLTLAGCSEEEPQEWWSMVTGFSADSLGYDDYWTASVPAGKNISFRARISSGELGRLDFSPQAGGYTVIYNHGRMYRLMPRQEEVKLERTVFLPYMIPFVGKEELGRILYQAGVDTSLVTPHIEWEGRLCTVVGDTLVAERSMEVGADAPPNISISDERPALYIDEATGAVVRMITVDVTDIGTRLGDFRLFDHELRNGAWLPKRFETWGPKGRRACMNLETQSDSKHFLPNLFEITE